MRYVIGLMTLLISYTSVSRAVSLDQAQQQAILYVKKATKSTVLKEQFSEVYRSAEKLALELPAGVNIITVDCEPGKIAFKNEDDRNAYNNGKIQFHLCNEALKSSVEEIAQTIIHESIHLIDKDFEEESTTKKELLIVHFGGGAPSLSYMQDFPINDIKIEEVIDTEEYSWLRVFGIKTTEDFLIMLARSYAVTGYSKKIQKILELIGSRRQLVLNHQDALGQTPLMLAIREGNIACAKLLHGAGARLDLKSNSGETAIDFALRYRRTQSLDLFKMNKSSVN